MRSPFIVILAELKSNAPSVWFEFDVELAFLSQENGGLSFVDKESGGFNKLKTLLFP